MMALELIGDALFKGTLLLVLVFALAYVVRKAPAAARHLVWAFGLAGVLAVPLLSKTMPWRLNVLPATTVTAVDAGPIMRQVEAPSASLMQPAPETAAPAISVAPGVATPSATRPVDGAAPPPSSGFALPTSATMLAVLPAVWLLGVGVLLARLALGVAAIQFIARRAVTPDAPEWDEALLRARRELNIDRSVRLVMSDAAPMPFTAGVVRPVVVLPRTADQWNRDRLHAVLLHELAHIRRRDVLAHVVSQAACALYWFHPLVWVAARRLRAECERACDDLVLGAGTRASDYAEHLLAIVRSAARRWTPAVALPMARRSEFEGRLLAILESPGRTRAVPRAAAASIAGFVALAVVPLAALAPNDAPQQDVSALAALEAASGEGAVSSPTPVTEAAESDPPSPSIDPAPASFDTASDIGGSITLNPSTPIAQAPQSGSRAVDALVMTLQDPNAGVREAAARSLASYQDTTAIRALARALAQDADPTVRRTAAWALGEMENPLAIPALSSALSTDSDPSVRAMAAWALGEIEDPRAVPALAEAVSGDREPRVRLAAIAALGDIEDPRGIASLRPALSDSSSQIRVAALRALGDIDDARAVDDVARVLRTDRDPEVRRYAAAALGEFDDGRAVEPLSAALGDQDRGVRIQVIRALGEIDDTRAVEPLLGLLGDADVEVRKYAAWALGEIEDTRATTALSAMVRNDADAEVRAVAVSALSDIEDRRAAPALAAALSDASVEVRRRAASALGDLDGLTEAPPELIRALQDADAQVRLRAVRSLGEIEDPSAVPALRPMLDDEVTDVRRATIRALGEIQHPSSYEVLVAALQDDDPEVRRLAARALGQRD